MRDDRAASIGRPDYGGRPTVCPDRRPPEPGTNGLPTLLICVPVGRVPKLVEVASASFDRRAQEPRFSQVVPRVAHRI